MNVRQLEAFCRIMETGTMSEAARLLGVSQPAISKSIRILEQTLRLPLFKRSGDRLYPSVEAQRLYPNARRIFDEIQNTEELSKKLRKAEVGTLRIAATYALTIAYVPDSIAAFHAKRPLIDIQFMAVPPRQVIDLISRNEVDVGLLYEPISEPEIDRIPICDVDIVCALPRDHRLTSKDVVLGNELVGETVISFNENSYGGSLIRQQCDAANIPLEVAISVNQTAVAINMASLGIGVAVIDSLSLNQQVLEKVCIKPFRPLCVLHVSAIVSAQRPLSFLAREFVASIEQSAKSHICQSLGFQHKA